MTIRSLADLTWRDALIIELRSMLDRVEDRQRIAGVTLMRLQALADEYEKERQARDTSAVSS